jgi:hypothetical protein
VFSVLTYYAYLAWVIFAALLAALIYACPPAGLLWLAVVILRVIQFLRLGARRPGTHCTRAPRVRDPESPLPLSVEPACAAPLECSRSSGTSQPTGCVAEPDCSECSCPRCEGGCEGGRLGRTLLVGNGPSIRDRGLGGVIDSFDTVVRFNSFVTKGLEEHTGSKTSLWCHMMQWCAPTPSQPPHPLTPSPLHSLTPRSPHPGRRRRAGTTSPPRRSLRKRLGSRRASRGTTSSSHL